MLGDRRPTDIDTELAQLSKSQHFSRAKP